MHLAYIGNFGPEHSTENHVAKAFEYNGHTVDRVQENEVGNWQFLTEGLPLEWDLIVWTRTGWDWASLGLAEMEARNLQLRFLINAHKAKIPVIGMHLDIWWGLRRQHQVAEEPFFLCDLLFTADGGHDEKWAEVGVNHVWMPPGVSLAETEPGMWRGDFASRIAFVGSWQGGYHPESEHRHALVQWLRENFVRDCTFWPEPGRPAVRGADLRDLYQSVDVVVGDSCFTGTGLARYWSDRIPETLGRGGYLLHPFVEGMVEQGFTSDTMAAWAAFDWEALGTQIEYALANPDHRTVVAAQGRELVRRMHTYEVRTNEISEILYERKLLKRPRAKK